MKKVLLFISLFLILIICVMFKSISFADDIKFGYLMDLPKYNKILPENIQFIKIIRYTEAGAFDREIRDANQILGIYNGLRKMKLTEETQMQCTDNTTIYVFYLKDGTNTSVEIECEWLVIDGKHYKFIF